MSGEWFHILIIDFSPQEIPGLVIQKESARGCAPRIRRLYRVRMHRPAPSAPYGGACMEVCLQRIRAQALMTSIHLQGQLQRVRTQDTASVWSPYGGLPPDGTHAAPVSRMEGQLRRVRTRHAGPHWVLLGSGVVARGGRHAACMVGWVSYGSVGMQRVGGMHK